MNRNPPWQLNRANQHGWGRWFVFICDIWTKWRTKKLVKLKKLKVKRAKMTVIVTVTLLQSLVLHWKVTKSLQVTCSVSQGTKKTSNSKPTKPKARNSVTKPKSKIPGVKISRQNWCSKNSLIRSQVVSRIHPRLLLMGSWFSWMSILLNWRTTST